LCCDNITYSERLAKLRLDSLELRRLRLDLVYAYKIIFGILETDVNAFFTISSTDINFTRGHNFKLLMLQSRIDVRKYFFACRIVRRWTSLAAEREHFSSLTFEKFLQQTNLSKFISFKQLVNILVMSIICFN